MGPEGHGPPGGVQREDLVQRLLVAVGSDHALARSPIDAMAQFTRQDEVLYRLDDGQEFLIAHPTYTPAPPDPHIQLRSFASWPATAAMVHEMAEMW